MSLSIFELPLVSRALHIIGNRAVGWQVLGTGVLGVVLDIFPEKFYHLVDLIGGAVHAIHLCRRVRGVVKLCSRVVLPA